MTLSTKLQGLGSRISPSPPVGAPARARMVAATFVRSSDASAPGNRPPAPAPSPAPACCPGAASAARAPLSWELPEARGLRSGAWALWELPERGALPREDGRSLSACSAGPAPCTGNGRGVSD